MDFNKRTFVNEEVRIDGNNFFDCQFDNCVMVYGGGPGGTMTGCIFNKVKWSFSEAAANTISFMTALYHGMGEDGKKLIEQTFKNIRKGNQPKI